MSEKINLNTATPDEIAGKVAMIGLEKAKALVDYRDARGPFSNFDEIKHVPGFSAKLIESLDVYFTIDEEKGAKKKQHA